MALHRFGERFFFFHPPGFPSTAIKFLFCKKSSSFPFTKQKEYAIILLVRGALAQLVAHNTGSVGVRSSNLLCSTNKKTLDLSRVFPCFGAFSTIVSTIIGFQTAFDSATRNRSKAVFLCSRYSILADQLLQLVGGLLLHVLVGMAVYIQREGNRGMSQGFRERFGIDVALQGQGREGVPLRYNYDKPEKPRISRVFGYLARFFILFQTEKSSREVVIS